LWNVIDLAPDRAAGEAPSGLATLTPHVAIRKVAVVVNVAAGSVGPGAPAAASAILERFGLVADVRAPAPADVAAALVSAIAERPDLLVVLAGDGTARAAAALCGPIGPLMLPLPGGTMNLLPRALYGPVDWRQALTAALARGVPRVVGGGEIGGRPFYVAAIMGSPALWAPAREAARQRRLGQALQRARLALRSLLTSKLRFSLDGVAGRAEALTLMCPLVSKAMTDETALEAAAIDVSEAGELVRVGLRTLAVELFGPRAGDWRDDPAVSIGLCRNGRVWAHGPIPAVLDGEPHLLPRQVKVRFVKNAFRALADPSVAHDQAPAGG
jgi:diacylglycerol kinase family enzyme